ncbi:EF hand [Jannaschia faecimaris]|uniref:EF hand n=1 Tax=Jannaschia faecimaris TaxID=1244108 RepID=A0A1H3SK96_9RHOB|nr:hypothetical protein [Jannaschia faecimaris]SDZ37539.1 EF hand [Jannaschia faecimaris]
MIRSALVFAALTVATATFATAQANWDLDADARLNPDEFFDGFGKLGTFRIFDRNGDAMLDASEWQNGPWFVGEYVNMDLNADGGVDELEFNALLFNRYDDNGSGRIEPAEIARVKADLAKDGLLAH